MLIEPILNTNPLIMTTKNRFIFFLFVLISTTAIGQKSKRLLIIGNSVTASNKMSLMLQQMFTNANDEVEVFEVTGGGMSLKNHLDILTGTGVKEFAISRIQKSANLDFTTDEKWDYVILQEGGIPYLIPEYRKNTILPTLKNWQKIFERENTEVFLFEPYATTKKFPKTYFRLSTAGDYDENTCCSDTLHNSSQEQNLLTTFVENISDELKFRVAPVGRSFTMLKSQQSKIPLLNEDNHPTRYGSYLMAAVYYQMISGKEIPVFSDNEFTSDYLQKLNTTANQANKSTHE